jgi:anthranilate synthase component 1
MEVYQPTLDAFRSLASGAANLIPVYREFAADLETPVSVYLKLMTEMGPSFLLESVEGGEQVGRYSFVGVNPRNMIALNGRSVTNITAGGRESRWTFSRRNWSSSCPLICLAYRASMAAQ